VSEMSNGELARQMAALREAVSLGFDGLNTRLEGLTDQVRVQNGRVTKLERSTDVGLQRILNLEREIFSSMKRPLTRGDAAIFVAGGAAILAAIRWLPALVGIGQGAP